MKWNWTGMGMALMGLVAASALVCLPATRLTADSRSVTRSDIDELKELKAQISLLNLVNGLNLTQDQLRQLIDLARTAQDTIGKALIEHSDLIQEAKCTLAEYRSLLESNGDITRKVERNVGSLDHELRESGEEVKLELASIAKRMQAVFSEAQLAVIADFAPCTIPPRNLKDPVRAGQARSGDHVVEALKKARLLDEAEFADVAPAKVDEKVRGLAEKLGGLLKEDIQAEKQRILDIAKEARAMSEEEFATSAACLAARVENEGRLAALRDKHKKMEGPMALTKKIGEYFLGDHALPILEHRRQLALSAKPAPQADLDTIKPADACRDGQCALEAGK
ncbi:MAG: hypothetical protein RDV41_01300 [Planctomycetota bacterium]|nr:hypothetical protein [Planctomycetota bacterium]